MSTISMRALFTFFSVVAALCLTACGEPLTQIVLQVNSDISTDEIGPVLITVRGPSDEIGVEYTANFARPGGPTGFPITLGLVLDDDAMGDMISVEVIASQVDGVDTVEASARTNFVPDSTRQLSLLLDTACIEIPCGSEETCQGGVCVDNVINGETLPVFGE